jgi:hypothetical protein
MRRRGEQAGPARADAAHPRHRDVGDRVPPAGPVLERRAARGHRDQVRVRGHDGRPCCQDRGCRGDAVTRVPKPAAPDYTTAAVAAVAEAAGAERDFGGWLAGVLATVAAQLGSSDPQAARAPGRPAWSANSSRARPARRTTTWTATGAANQRLRPASVARPSRPGAGVRPDCSARASASRSAGSLHCRPSGPGRPRR